MAVRFDDRSGCLSGCDSLVTAVFTVTSPLFVSVCGTTTVLPDSAKTVVIWPVFCEGCSSDLVLSVMVFVAFWSCDSIQGSRYESAVAMSINLFSGSLSSRSSSTILHGYSLLSSEKVAKLPQDVSDSGGNPLIL